MHFSINILMFSLNVSHMRSKTHFKFFLRFKLILFFISFPDVSLIAVPKTPEHQKVDTSKSKWNQWSPLAALTTKSEKKRTQDDAALSVSTYSM